MLTYMNQCIGVDMETAWLHRKYKNCLSCNKEIILLPCRDKKFCSQRCMGDSYKRKEWPIFSCATCGNTFTVRKNYAKFCSPGCIRYCGPKDKLSTTKDKGFWKNATEEKKLSRLSELFDKQVIKRDGCWGWKGRLGGKGYGQVMFIRSNRLSWMIHKGPIPNGLLVLHSCDNPPCTNPDHLFLGTPQDNTTDMMNKNRWSGNKHGINGWKKKVTT
jgi:hypothetical protein